jgi:hypothetical protein
MSAAEERPFGCLSDSERRVLDVFHAWSVESVIVGGYAMRVHGCLRDVEDLDLVIDTTPANLDRLEAALVQLGVSIASAVRQHFLEKQNPRWDVAEGLTDYYVDLLASVHTFRFADLIVDALVVTEGDLVIHVISREKLIITKRETMGAPKRVEKAAQDRADLAFLTVGR